jgi:osmotically inducible protein OsmC
MAVSNELSKAGFVPDRVHVTVDVGADKREAGWTVVSSHITLRARVPGVDQATFEEQADKAKGGCPISRALSESVEVTVDAALEA